VRSSPALDATDEPCGQCAGGGDDRDRAVCEHDARNAMHRTRGGCWNDYPRDFRSARRSSAAPDDRWSATGFRVARSLAGEQRM
jgi:formylglycine-generating enzyme required for sulfatase activity